MVTQHRSPRRAVRFPGSVLVNTVLVLASLAGLAYLAPSLFGYERYVITGGSMSGTFEKGSVVFEKPVPIADLRVGDVITYLPPADSGVSTLVTHRIVKVYPSRQRRPAAAHQGRCERRCRPVEVPAQSAPSHPCRARCATCGLCLRRSGRPRDPYDRHRRAGRPDRGQSARARAGYSSAMQGRDRRRPSPM